MRRLMVGVAVGLAFLVPSAASAQVFFGVRLNYAFAGGDIDKDAPIKDLGPGMIPIQVDLGLDVAKAVAIGVYGSAGYTMIGNEFKDYCETTNRDCLGLNVRLGAQATLHALVGQSKVWGGVLLGWEQQRYKMARDGNYSQVDYRGVEGGVQGGVDFPTSGAFRWGPFVGYSIGEFQSAALSVSGFPPGDLEPITEKSRHSWLSVGIRGVFGL